jgi:sn-glycerol 3-phosphate transport system permease protein
MKKYRLLQNLPIHFCLIIGALLLTFPVYFALVGSTWDPGTIARGEMPLVPGPYAVENYLQAWRTGSGQRVMGAPVATMMSNSLFLALMISIGKIFISIVSAYAVVFFRFPGRMLFFWVIFASLMLPVEVRIIPTFRIVSDLGLINTYLGLTLPLVASATATFLFRQFFLAIPDEMVEAAKMDGAGPVRFFLDIVLPISRTSIAALFVIMFVYGWNQFLWPLLMTTSRDMNTVVMGLVRMIGSGEAQTDWHVIMAATILALLPPTVVVVFMQRWFVKGLTETEK